MLQSPRAVRQCTAAHFPLNAQAISEHAGWAVQGAPEQGP